MSEWKEYKLSELGTVVGGATPSTKNPNFYDGEIPWITPKDLTNWNDVYISKGERSITEEGYKSASCKMMPKGTVLFTSRAPIGYIAIAANDVCTNQGFKSIIPNPNIVDSVFLYYALMYNRNRIKSLGSGTTFAEVSGKVMSGITISIPSIDYQRKIASILSDLDNKMSVNRRIYRNLESQAQTLFQNWFIDFKPFTKNGTIESELGIIPKGWKVISLSEIMDYAGGSQPPASQFISEYKDGYVRFVQIRDYETNSHLTYIPISKKNKLCFEKDIMIARYGVSLGRICMGLNGAYNVALAKVFPKKEYYREYLRCFLKTNYFYQKINSVGGRAAQSGFNKSDINSFLIAFPEEDGVIKEFEEICTLFIDKMLNIKKENNILTQLRNTLLPKLMTGQIKL